MKKIQITIIFLFVLSAALVAQNVKISGYIRDSITGEVLVGANVYDSIVKLGAVTNSMGYFNIVLKSGQISVLKFSFVGYQTKEVLINTDSVKFLDVLLSDFNLLAEVEIVADNSAIETSEIGVLKIPMSQIKNMPMVLGEVDIIKTFQLMPGVFSGKEGTSGIYVRGGSPDQNLFLLDDIPLYYVSHIGGFLSTFDADAINDVKLYKGGFPARYGGRLSSVVDLRMKDGNKNNFKGVVSIGTLSTKFSIEGPIKKNSSSFFLSIRRCNVDLITRAVSLVDSDGKTMAGYTFYDLYSKYNKVLKNGDRFFISMYSGRDNIFLNINEKSQNALNPSFKIRSNVIWGNVMMSMKYTRKFNQNLFGNISIAYSKYKYKDHINSKSSAPGGGELTNESILMFDSGVGDIIAKADFDLFLINRHKVRFGFANTFHMFSPGNSYYSGIYSSGDSISFSEPYKINAFESNFYFEDEFSLGTKLDLNIGTHFSIYTIQDITFKSFQPRVNINYQMNNKASFKCSYVRMVQYLHLLSNSGAGLPSDLWVPASVFMPPESADQLSAGLVFITDNNRPIEISIESFIKQMHNLVEYKEGTNFFGNNHDLQSKVETDGSALVYGIEFLAQKKLGRITGWIAYTWSKNTRQFDNINGGKPFPYKYDRRHDISIVCNYELNERIFLSATWVYSTGDALTLATNHYGVLYHDYNSLTGIPFSFYDVHLYDGRNSYRMPAFHKLDLGVNFTKQKKHGLRTWNVSVYNAYCRQNAFFLFYKYDSAAGYSKLYQISLFPIIPSVSYSFKF